MDQPSGDLERLVAATANRLRLIQSDLADQEESVRSGMINEEIDRALAGLVMTDHQAFLEELSARFPSWDERREVIAEGEGAPRARAQSAADARELNDWAFLVKRLCDLSPTLPEDQRRTAVEKLRGAGYPTGAKFEWPDELLKWLRVQLKTGEKAEISPVRALEMLGLMASLIRSLETIGWTTWRHIAAQSTFRAPGELAKDLARFVSDDREVSRPQLEKECEALRQLIAGLLTAIVHACKTYPQRMISRLAPENIEMGIKVGPLVSKEKRCWDKYVEQAREHLNQGAVEREIRQIIGEYTEQFVRRG